MTISQAIALVDRLKPSQYDAAMKKQWLSKLDGMIFKEVFQTHADCPLSSFAGYANVSLDTQLLVPEPYDEDVYNYFLQAQIDKENGEIAKYNQSIMMYNNAFQNFAAWYNRTHMPLSNGNVFVI